MSEIRLAVRRLMHRRSVMMISVITLATAIGAAAATWSLLSAVLLNPLPVRDPERLAMVGRAYQSGGISRIGGEIYPVLPTCARQRCVRIDRRRLAHSTAAPSQRSEGARHDVRAVREPVILRCAGYRDTSRARVLGGRRSPRRARCRGSLGSGTGARCSRQTPPCLDARLTVGNRTERHGRTLGPHGVHDGGSASRRADRGAS